MATKTKTMRQVQLVSSAPPSSVDISVSQNRVNVLGGAHPEQILAMVKSKKLSRLAAQLQAEEGQDEDESEEEEGEEEDPGACKVKFNRYLNPEQVETLKAALHKRSFEQEAAQVPPPTRQTKYFDLHLPAETKQKLGERFDASLIKKIDTTPPPVPFEVIPDFHVRLPPVGDVRKLRRESFTTMRQRLQSASKMPEVELRHFDNEKVKNPFYYPKDVPAFMVKVQNERRKKRLADLEIPTTEKLNGVSLIQQVVTARVKPYQTEHAVVDSPAIYNKIVWEAQHGLNITRLQKVARKIHANYINYRKMIFYQEYGIHARNQALKQMRDTEADEEMALKTYEYLSRYTQESLDNFLRENEESTNLAGKIAEEKMKDNMQLSIEVRNLKLETSSMKNEITALNEGLRECKYYMKFLDGVARELMRRDEEEQYRKERRQQQIKEDIADYMKEGMTLRQAQKAIKLQNKEYASKLKKKDIMETESGEFIKKLAEEAKAQAERSPINSRINSILQVIANSAIDGEKFSEEDLFKELDLVGGTEREDREELSSLVFTKPSQLLNIYVEVEEQNLSLIQHAQINEESLESVEKKIRESRLSTENRSRQLRDIINEIEQQIQETNSRINTLKLLIDMFTGGYYDVKSQEKMMRLLRHHVNKVYKASVGVNDAHLDTVLMLTSIEKNFEDLVHDLEAMPQDIVLKISRDLEKERRESERLEIELERKRLSDKRAERNLIRTTKGAQKIKRGRNLAFRSRPPKLEYKLTQKELDKKAEEEEWNYYFGVD